jgi:cytochrome c553
MKKWIKRIALGLVSVIVLFVAVVFAVSEARFRKQYDVAAATGLSVTRDPAQIARGQHLVTAVAKCVDCHAQDLGGKVFIEPGPMGTVIASNLTTGKGGVLASYTDAQIETAIRHGVRRNGRGLIIMPSDEYQNLSDADVSAIIAYLRSLRPVDREFEHTTKLGPIGRGLLTFGVPIIPAARIDHQTPPASRAAVPPVGPTREYGQYLVSVGGCRGCHGPNLVGAPGHGPDEPASANITPAGAIGRWSEADFTRAIRTGTRPDGTRISEAMPWKSMSRHTDDELHAIWLYLKTVPPVQSPARS